MQNKKGGHQPSRPYRWRQGGAKFANFTSKIESPFKKYPTIRISSNLVSAFIVRSPLNM